jgi:hypothetical protein
MLKLDDNAMRVNITEHMSKLVIFTNDVLKMNNITFPCGSSIEQIHCNRGKLLISKDIFDECVLLLMDDIRNPYRREYIIQLTTNPINLFIFTRKENEVINIYQI